MAWLTRGMVGLTGLGVALALGWLAGWLAGSLSLSLAAFAENVSQYGVLCRGLLSERFFVKVKEA